jgi:hypothetical protein
MEMLGSGSPVDGIWPPGPQISLIDLPELPACPVPRFLSPELVHSQRFIIISRSPVSVHDDKLL